MENIDNNVVAEPQVNVAPAPSAPAPSTPAPKAKKSSGLVLGLILCLLLAAGGVGFGVFEMMEGNKKDTRISDYKNEVATLNAQVQTLNNTIDELNEKATDGIDEDYIYITELGVKIKKPSNFKDLVDRYIFSNGYPMAIDTFQIIGRDTTTRTIRFGLSGKDDVDSCKESIGENDVCFELNGKIYMVMEEVGHLTPGEKLEEPDEFVKYFLNPENYSEI